MVKQRSMWAAAFVVCMVALAALACQGNAVNMTIEGTPKFICPSSTPKPTHTPLPPNPPTYPAGFAANLNYYFVDTSRDFVTVQYIAQSAGFIRIAYWGTYDTGFSWLGSNGYLFVNYSPPNAPGFSGAYGVLIPPNVTAATILFSSDVGGTSFFVTRYASTVPGSSNPGPCCLGGAIYPTPRPTYTPWPTPTLYKIEAPQDFYLGVPIRNDTPPVSLKMRLRSVNEATFALIWPLFTAVTWEMEIQNIGSTEFDFLGALQMYVSEVELWNGQLKAGVWSPSHEAADFLGIVEQAYNPRALMPGQSMIVKVAAWIPSGAHTKKISFVMDTYHSGDPGYATFVPGEGRILTWANQSDTGCPAWSW